MLNLVLETPKKPAFLNLLENKYIKCTMQQTKLIKWQEVHSWNYAPSYRIKAVPVLQKACAGF